MEAVEGLLYGMEVLFTPGTLLGAFIGVLIGTAVGVLPGLGPVAGAALIFPLTFTLDPLTGLVMIAGIYSGAMYGGSTASILMKVPGDTAAVVATFDGYEMTRRGRAGAALSITAVGSFVAGTIAVVLVTFFSVYLAKFGLLFGPPEFFALTAGSLLVFARITGGSLTSGIFPLVIGLLLGTVGQEAVTGEFRFTFGILELGQGLALTPVAVGLFGVAEVLILTESARRSVKVSAVKVREMFPTREEWSRAIAPWGRGSVVGFILGLLPGPSGALSTFASYRLEKAVSRNRHQLGRGAVEGVAGPEAANNAASTSSLVPVLSLGIPFSATLALMLAAMIVQGVEPGPLLVEERPDLFWGIVASMYVGNIILLILNLPLVGVWVNLLRTPQYLLVLVILVLSVVGAFSVRHSMLDVFSLLVFGLVGYGLRKLDFSLAPLILGLVLGPLIENYFRESLFLGKGDLSVFVSSPIAVALWVGVGVIIVGAFVGPRVIRARRS